MPKFGTTSSTPRSTASTAIGEVTVNWPEVLKRKNAIVTKHAKGLDFLMRKNKVTVVPGHGRTTGPAAGGVHTVQVSTGDGDKAHSKPCEGQKRHPRNRLRRQNAARACRPTQPS